MKISPSLQKVQSHECQIEIFGLGYVGLPLSLRLANSGFKVTGIDTDANKIERLKAGLLLDSHENFKPMLSESLSNKKFVPSTEPQNSDLPKIGIICVPTPISDESNVYVFSAVESFLQTAKAGDVIILESSVILGTTKKVEEIIESNGYKVGEDFGLGFCPERIDPLNKKWNLENIPRVVYCSDDTTFQITQKIYQHVNNANLHRVKSPEIAEVVKSFENAFRLVNISLVNELAILCDKLKINVKDVLDAAATKPFGFMQFSPGAGAGGHCIPKDPTFLVESAKKMGLTFSSIENATRINSQLPKYIIDSIQDSLDSLQLARSVIVCGLAYKPDIEDMRDSPGFRILKELHGCGFKVASYDPYYKSELLDKYLVENKLEKFDFTVLDSLNEETIKDYSCICVVQNHTKTKFRIKEIYKNSLVPMIYDCQNTISQNPDSKTILNRLGH